MARLKRLRSTSARGDVAPAAGIPTAAEWKQFKALLLNRAASATFASRKQATLIKVSVGAAKKKFQAVRSGDLLFILGIKSWHERVTTTWKSCATRLLALGALWACNHTVKANKEAEVKMVQRSHKKFAEALELATVDGYFNFERVKTRRQQLRALVDCQEVFMGMKFLTLRGSHSRAHLRERYVDVPDGVALPNPALHAAISDAWKDRNQSAQESKVVVVGGESGSGKTVSALQCASAGGKYCVYLLASDLSLSEAALLELDRGARNMAIDAELQRVLRDVLETTDDDDGDNTGALMIVIDEIGSYPTLLRGLCAISYDGLREVSHVRDVMLIAVGTGADAASNEIGSLPTRFRRVRVASADVARVVWADVLRAEAAGTRTEFDKRLNACKWPSDAMTAFDQVLKCASSVGDSNRVLAYTIGSTPQLRQTLRDMTTNARLTALLRRCLRNLASRDGETTCCSDREGHTLWRLRLEHAITEAMICFRALNSLGGVPMELCMGYFGGAFGLACGNRHQELPEEWQDLVSMYGMVTDNAVVFQKPPRTHHVIRKLRDREYLCIHKDEQHRFSITAAQVALAMRQFGFTEPEWSGGGFEAALADYLWLVSLAGMSGVRITSEREPAPPPGTMAAVRSLLLRRVGLLTKPPQRGRTVRRVKLQSAVASEAEAQAALLDLHLKKFGSGGDPAGSTVIVALNADKAPFADLMVAGFLGSTLEWVLLVQVKHYPRTPLTAAVCWKEMYKMGCRDQLPSIKAGFEEHLGNLMVSIADLERATRGGTRLAIPQWALLQMSIWHVAECSLHLGIDERALGTLIRRPATLRSVVDSVRTLPRHTLSDERLGARMDFVACAVGLEQHQCQRDHESARAVVRVERFIIAFLADDAQSPADAPRQLVHFNSRTAMAAFAPSSIGCLAGTAPASHQERCFEY